jgi:TrpR-related protein YerC/YecD
MDEPVETVWRSEAAQRLAMVLTIIDDSATMRLFLRDVMTEKEIIEISARLEAARMLRANATYADIIEKTELSSRTVARISDWLQNGCGGYVKALEALEIHGHIPPAHAV